MIFRKLVVVVIVVLVVAVVVVVAVLADQTKTRKKIGSTGTCTRYKICIIYQKKIGST